MSDIKCEICDSASHMAEDCSECPTCGGALSVLRGDQMVPCACIEDRILDEADQALVDAMKEAP